MPLWDNYSHQIKDLPTLSSPTTDTDVVAYSNPSAGMGVKSQRPGLMPSHHAQFLSVGSLNLITSYLNLTEKTRTHVPFDTTLYGFSAVTEQVWNGGGIQHQPAFNMMRLSNNSYLDGGSVTALMPLPGSTRTSSWTTPFASLVAFANSYPGKATGQLVMYMPPQTAGNTTAVTGSTFYLVEMAGH